MSYVVAVGWNSFMRNTCRYQKLLGGCCYINKMPTRCSPKGMFRAGIAGSALETMDFLLFTMNVTKWGANRVHCNFLYKCTELSR
jgi:hypothetical protein